MTCKPRLKGRRACFLLLGRPLLEVLENLWVPALPGEKRSQEGIISRERGWGSGRSEERPHGRSLQLRGESHSVPVCFEKK